MGEFRVRIKIDYKILIIMGILALTKQFNIYIVFMLFTIVHEIGHILIAIVLKQKIYAINILPIGCTVDLGINIRDYNTKFKRGRLINLKKAIISISGPITSILIAIILWYSKIGTVNIIYTNLLIGIFNLLPIDPLDGEQFLRNSLKIFLGMKKANEITNKVSYIVIIVISILISILILKYHNIALVIAIFYLWYMRLQRI